VWLVCDGSRRRQGDGEPEIRWLRGWVRSERLLVEGIRHDGNNVSGAVAKDKVLALWPPRTNGERVRGKPRHGGYEMVVS